jgi:prophage tail gpP-like protein
MPNPNEYATVIAGGLVYQYWQTVEVEREYGHGLDLARVAVAEIGSPTTGWITQRLAPGDPAQVLLGDRLVINGKVTIRQAAYDANKHAVEITVTSPVLSLIKATVNANPGQYLNSTLQQIASAVAGAVGVNFSIVGSPSGANLPFARVSEHPGETRFDFIERLCRMRNIHLLSDGQGTLLGTRGGSGNIAATLTEGVNIESARLVMRDDNAVNQITTIGSLPGGSSTGAAGDATRDIKATATNPNYTGPETMTVAAPQPGTAAEMAMHSNHEVNLTVTTQLDCEIVTPGWFLPDGSLWMDHLGTGEDIMIYSPMLFPSNGMALRLKRVVHRQSSEEGTTTLLGLCLPNGLGSPEQVNASGPPGTPVPDPAQPG